MTNPEFRQYTSETVSYKIQSPDTQAGLIEELIEVGIPAEKIIGLPADAVMVMFTNETERDILIAEESNLVMLIEVVHLTLNN